MKVSKHVYKFKYSAYFPSILKLYANDLYNSDAEWHISFNIILFYLFILMLKAMRIIFHSFFPFSLSHPSSVPALNNSSLARKPVQYMLRQVSLGH